MVGGIQWEAVMKVFLSPEDWMSLGIKRVATALVRYKPSDVLLVNKQEEADHVIVHMVGDGQRKHWINPQQEYSCIQYCLRTTELPNTKDWVEVWGRAKAVWSYYDLKSKIAEDLYSMPHTFDEQFPMNFYYAPLGVDGNVFKPNMPVRKPFLIGTSGYIAATECVDTVHRVCVERLQRMQFHLGPNLNLGAYVTYANSIPDEIVSEFWAQCSFVAGLRAIEGFELPVLEGLACGARPIVFNAPHYTHWFGEHAEVIPEDRNPDAVEAALYDIMSRPVRSVSVAEQREIVKKFNWEPLAKGFWEAIR